jgi:hypothetical protein
MPLHLLLSIIIIILATFADVFFRTEDEKGETPTRYLFNPFHFRHSHRKTHAIAPPTPAPPVFSRI